MTVIDGFTIQNLGFDPMKLGDFIYYEGPLLSHFVDRQKSDDHYLYRWVDNDDTAHRWLVVKVSEKELLRFLTGLISLRDVLQAHPYVTLLDLEDNLVKRQILVAPTHLLPDVYFPTTTSFFKEDLYHPYALKVKESLLQKQQEQSLLKELLDSVHSLKTQQTQILHLLNPILSRPLPSSL